MARMTLAALMVAAALALSACGVAAGDAGESPDTAVGGPAAGICHVDTPDCDDVSDGDAFDSESERSAARDLLGMAEGELAPEVRVGRQGDEHMMLTEDYVLGRKTVELDADADGVFRVVKVTVELPDGPESFTE